MRNLLILLFALVMSHPVIAQSDVSIKVDKVEYEADKNGKVTFTVYVKSSDLNGQTVDVYYYVQGDKSGKNGKEGNPLKAQGKDNTYTFTVSDLKPDESIKDNQYTAVIFAGLGTFETGEFTKYDEYYQNFSTEPATPEITITFPEGSYSSSEQDDKNAQIFVHPVVTAPSLNDLPDLYYNLYLDEILIRQEVKMQRIGFLDYTADIKNLEFSREYRVEVYATVGGVPSKSSSFTITTVPDPNANPAPAVSVQLGEIDYKVTEKDATFFVNVEAPGLTADQKVDVYYYLQGDKSGKNGTAEKPEKATFNEKDKVYTFTLSDLEPDKKYNVVIFAGVDTKDGSVQSEEKTVAFKTEALNPEVTVSIPEGFYYSEKQNASSAQIVVQPKVDAQNASDYIVYLYYNLYLGNTLQKEEVKVSQTGAGYEFNFKIQDLAFSREYKVEVWAKVENGDLVLCTSNHASFTITTVNNDGVTTLLIETDGNSDVRYFDLQGNELKNPAKGRVYIKVEGNKAVKVVK